MSSPQPLPTPIAVPIRDALEHPAAIQDHLFNFLLENTPDRIYFKDTASRFLRASRSMAELFRIQDVSELVGKSDFDFFASEHAEAAFKDEQEVMRSGRPMVGKEEKETLPDGRISWAITTKMPLRDSDGRIIGTCGISRDITERKKLEQQLLRSQRLESIGTLASGVAHDLNNILAPILLSAPLIRDALAPEYHNLLFAVEKAAQRGADIIKQVLTFAKGVEGERTLLQPKYVADEIIEIARQTFPKPISIVHQSRKDAWTVSADATQLHQVLLNLCVNARDAMPNGGTLTVGIDNVELDEHYAAMMGDAKPGRYVVFLVKDTGTGIPPEILENIFDPFFTTKDVGKGTGLGLSTVRGIVKSHGGSVYVYSEPGKGSMFKVFLPASNEEEQVAQPVAVDEACLTGSGETILIVEDEIEIRSITETILKSSGYNILSAADGTEALAIYARHGEKIDLVLTDVMMPHFDGTALTRTLKKMNPKVKIIASSGNDHDARVAELRLLQPEAILLKPYTKQQLLETIYRTIKSRE